MDDEGKTGKKLIKCEDLSDEERFDLSDCESSILLGF